MVQEVITKRMMILITFGGLLALKVLGYNGTIDDAILLVIGVIAGKEVLKDVEEKT